MAAVAPAGSPGDVVIRTETAHVRTQKSSSVTIRAHTPSTSHAAPAPAHHSAMRRSATHQHHRQQAASDFRTSARIAGSHARSRAHVRHSAARTAAHGALRSRAAAVHITRITRTSHKDAGVVTSETYQVGSQYYRVRYLFHGKSPYAIIQRVSGPHAQSMLTRISSYPAVLLTEIGRVLSSLARTGGGGMGALAALPFPMRTVLLGLILAGLGVLIRGLSLAMRLADAPASAPIAEIGAEAVAD